MHRLSAITLVTLATLIYMFAVIRYPIYLTTDTGSLRENSPPCGFGVTFSSRMNDSAAPQCLCPLYPHTLRESFNSYNVVMIVVIVFSVADKEIKIVVHL